MTQLGILRQLSIPTVTWYTNLTLHPCITYHLKVLRRYLCALRGRRRDWDNHDGGLGQVLLQHLVVLHPEWNKITLLEVLSLLTKDCLLWFRIIKRSWSVIMILCSKFRSSLSDKDNTKVQYKWHKSQYLSRKSRSKSWKDQDRQQGYRSHTGWPVRLIASFCWHQSGSCFLAKGVYT